MTGLSEVHWSLSCMFQIRRMWVFLPWPGSLQVMSETENFGFCSYIVTYLFCTRSAVQLMLGCTHVHKMLLFCAGQSVLGRIERCHNSVPGLQGTQWPTEHQVTSKLVFSGWVLSSVQIESENVRDISGVSETSCSWMQCNLSCTIT